MREITDSMARYIDNIPDGAVHTCSDLCIKPSCLIVRGKQEIERLRHDLARAMENHTRDLARLADLEAAATASDRGVMALRAQRAEARLAEAEALLREARDKEYLEWGCTRFVMRCDAHLESTPDSANACPECGSPFSGSHFSDCKAATGATDSAGENEGA